MTTDSTPNRRPWLALVGPVLAAALLMIMGVSNAGFPDAEDAVPYHKHILAETDTVDNDFGTWTSKPIEVPPSAIELLRPNAILSRAFVDTQNQREAGFLIVQCKDARDLSGHWPPNCYKANGYTQTDTQPTTWDLDGLTIPGVEYTFSIDTAGRQSTIVVSNFMILPGVGFVPDMFSVREAGADPQRRHFGAAQVQVVVDASYPQEIRDQIFDDLIRGYLPLIRDIVSLPEEGATPATASVR